MKKSVLIALALMTAAGAASAAEPATKDDVQQTAAQDDGDKVLCKTEKITGTRSKVKRTCMSKREWAELAAATRKNIDDFSREAGQVPMSKDPVTGLPN